MKPTHCYCPSVRQSRLPFPARALSGLDSMSLPEVIAQLVLPIEALATASLGAIVAVPSVLLHMATVLSRPSKGTLTSVRTSYGSLAWCKSLRGSWQL